MAGEFVLTRVLPCAVSHLLPLLSSLVAAEGGHSLMAFRDLESVNGALSLRDTIVGFSRRKETRSFQFSGRVCPEGQARQEEASFAILLCGPTQESKATVW